MSVQSIPPTIREQLEAERAALRSQLAELGFGDSPKLSYASGFADTSQATAERGEAEALASSLEDSLREVEHALTKFDNGTFGSCENCSNDIPAVRLEAMPMSKLCMDCVSAR